MVLTGHYQLPSGRFRRVSIWLVDLPQPLVPDLIPRAAEEDCGWRKPSLHLGASAVQRLAGYCNVRASMLVCQ